RASSLRRDIWSWAPADCSGACAAGCRNRLVGRGVPSARPAPFSIRSRPPGGRRSALRRGGRRATRLAPRLASRNGAAPLATVHPADPRPQGGGGGVSATPAASPMALDRILPWRHSRWPQGAILLLGRPAGARYG